MPDIALEDAAWAAEAYAAGRPLDFIASVLGVKPKQAFTAIKARRRAMDMPATPQCVELSAQRQQAEKAFERIADGRGRQHDDYRRTDDEGEFIDKPQTSEQKAAMEEFSRFIGRRKNLLRRRLARHWDMIWYLRARGMRGRTLRMIYGADVLIWAMGGGIDADVS